MFATAGEAAYPDSTFTLRLSYGRVQGLAENGNQVPPFTLLRGLFARAEEHRMQPPYQLPARWLAARQRLELATPYNLVSTNDIVEGNSGSPLMTRKGSWSG